MEIARRAGAAAMRRAVSAASTFAIAASSIGGAALLLKERRSAAVTVLLKQIYFTGVEALPVVTLTAILCGLIVVTELFSIAPRLGREALIGDMLVWIIVREGGPVFAAVIVIARSGTAIAAELGAMRVAREIRTLEAMGIDPLHYLVMPRVAAAGVCVMALAFYFEAAAILGGYMLAGVGGSMTFYAYLSSVLDSIGPVELVVSTLKSVVFGLVIGSICTRRGLMVAESITRIPQETTRAVIESLASVFVFDAALTFLFFIH